MGYYTPVQAVKLNTDNYFTEGLQKSNQTNFNAQSPVRGYDGTNFFNSDTTEGAGEVASSYDTKSFAETAGSLAHNSAVETAGSLASSGSTETAGSLASCSTICVA